MKTFTALGLAAAYLLASPAFAGPAGTGLTFTEEVAKKRLAQAKAAKQQAASECVMPKTTDAEADASSKTTAADICRAS